MVRVVGLLTDFGLRDHYVAAMKGVILGIAPEVSLVDITHEIPPQDIVSAALELAACYRDFPPGTIFLVVVDPGVGTERRAMAAAADPYFFVGPDNGVFAPVLDRSHPTVVHLTESRFALPAVSRTFEGRDRFAPAAAWLARGADIREMGQVMSSYLPLDLPAPRVNGSRIEGQIVKVDRFGNLISNLREGAHGAVRSVSIAGRDVPLVETYGKVPPGECCALAGGGGYLEVAVNGGSAAELLRVGRGASITMSSDPEPLTPNT